MLVSDIQRQEFLHYDPVQQADGIISVYFCLAQAVGTLTPWSSFYHQVDNHGPAPTTRTYGYNVPKVVCRMKVLMVKSARGRNIYEEPLTDMRPPERCMMYCSL